MSRLRSERNTRSFRMSGKAPIGGGDGMRTALWCLSTSGAGGGVLALTALHDEPVRFSSLRDKIGGRVRCCSGGTVAGSQVGTMTSSAASMISVGRAAAISVIASRVARVPGSISAPARVSANSWREATAPVTGSTTRPHCRSGCAERGMSDTPTPAATRAATASHSRQWYWMSGENPEAAQMPLTTWLHASLAAAPTQTSPDSSPRSTDDRPASGCPAGRTASITSVSRSTRW